jgi:DnaK suppressor protein
MDPLCLVPGRGVPAPAARAAISAAVLFRAAHGKTTEIPGGGGAMRRQDDGPTSPRWRGVLEARWRARLEEVTELSVAYHAAAADMLAGVEDPRARLLLHRATEARQRLADTEDALGKMATGDFGRCEHCGVFIAEVLLAAVPESRYCTSCTVDLGAGDMRAGDLGDPGPAVIGAAASAATTGWARTGAAGRR